MLDNGLVLDPTNKVNIVPKLKIFFQIFRSFEVRIELEDEVLLTVVIYVQSIIHCNRLVCHIPIELDGWNRYFLLHIILEKKSLQFPHL